MPGLPKRTPIRNLRHYRPTNTFQNVTEEQNLIKRVRAKVAGLIPTRTPVPFLDDYIPKDGDGTYTSTFKSILTNEPFEVTEEEINDAAEAAVRDGFIDPVWNALTDKMIRASCAFFAQEILTGPADPPYNGKFFISEHHEEWDELVCKYNRICILAARDHGKCTVGDDLLLKADGSRERVVDWKGGKLVVWDQINRKFVIQEVPPAISNGIRRVLRIKTRTGRELTVTENHPLLTWNGWVHSKNLSTGDRIAVAKELGWVGNRALQDAWLLGVVTGDGGSTESSVVVTSMDSGVIQGLTEGCRRHGWRLVPCKHDSTTYRLSTREGQKWGTAVAWARKHGIKGKVSKDKRVPKAVFRARQSDVSEFVSGCFDAGGTVNPCGGGSAEFYSASKGLLQDVQHLLVRLGVLSVLSLKREIYDGKEHLSWRLSIQGRDLIQFSYVLKGLRSAKKCQLDRVVKVAIQEPDQELFNRVQEPILWDEIVSVEPAGEAMTYGLQVPHYQTYLSNDIVNHNTFFWNFAFPLWMTCTNPWGKGFILSATANQAERILEDIIAEVEGNPQLRWLIPSRTDSRKWSSRYVRFSNNHRIYARGFGTKVRGFHPDYIIGDDVLNDETIYSEVVRRKQSEYWFTAISNMVVPGGKIVVVGCVTPDTWIATRQGLKKIGKLNPGNLTPEKYYNIDLEVLGLSGFQKAHKFWVQGEVPTKRVTLEFGYRLEGSYRHPFWVMGEDGIPVWRRADELLCGDYVAVRAGAEVWGTDILVRTPHQNSKASNVLSMPLVVDEDLAYFLGLWTAEGSYERTGRIAISNTEPEIRKWLENTNFGLSFQSNTTVGSSQTVRCSSKIFLDWMRNVGVVLGTAEKKVIPEKIMSAPKRIVREFLRGLFDGDGNVWVSNNRQQVMLGTVSESLARDTQTILLNFGILAFLRKRPPAKPTKKVPNGGKYPLWVLIMTAEDAWKYMQQIGFRLSRKQACIADMRSDLGSRVRGIPYQAAHIGRARVEKSRRPRSAQLSSPPINISAVAQAKRPFRSSLNRVATWFEENGSRGEGVARLRANLEHPELIWLRVDKIEDSRSMTMDFVIEGDHSFITNGIVSHNTPFHKDDLYHELEENEEYTFRKYPAINSQGKALWPERYTLQHFPPKGSTNLRQKRREIGPVRFTREFLCEPVADDMSLFPLRLFRGDPIEQFNVVLGMPAEFWDKAGVTRFMGVDFAMSSSVSADYTVLFILGLDNFGNRWIVDLQREKGLPYQEQLSLINRVARKYDPALIFLEANQMQRIFGDELIRTSDLPIRKFTTGVQKNSLDKGVPSLRVLLENGKFRIPRGDKESVKKTDIWIDEMRSITWQDGKIQSVSGHDDTVLACWIADQAVRHGGFKFSFGNEEYEGSLDDFISELTGGEEEPEEGENTSEKTDKKQQQEKSDSTQLEGEDLLRAILKKKMGKRKKVKVPTKEKIMKMHSNPGVHDLVDEDEFFG